MQNIYIITRKVLVILIVKLIFILKKINFLHKVFFLKNIFYLYDLHKLVEEDLCWWTYSIQNELPTILKKNKVNKILEYGSGASTLYFSKRNYFIISIEYDYHWFLKIKEIITKYSRSKIILIKSDKKEVVEYKSAKDFKSYEKYVKHPKNFNFKFDLIVIDGRARNKCLDQSINFISENGIIIFDDSERKRYRKGIDKFLKNYGYKEIKYKGKAPGTFTANRVTSLICK